MNKYDYVLIDLAGAPRVVAVFYSLPAAKDFSGIEEWVRVKSAAVDTWESPGYRIERRSIAGPHYLPRGS